MPTSEHATTTAAVTARPITPDELDAFIAVDQMAFGHTPVVARPPSTKLLEVDRSIAGFAGERMVGCLSAYSLQLSVPGGARVDTAGTTWVGVLPTHRRRGALHAMMQAHFAEVMDRGEPLAALWASEPEIYGRFGYGVASRALGLRVGAGSLSRRPIYGDRPEVLLRNASAGHEDLQGIYDTAAAQRPGATQRSDGWWAKAWFDPPENRHGSSELRVLTVPGRGFAAYSTKGWDPDGELTIRDLISTDHAARAALWEVLVSHDLISRVIWDHAPADEPVLDWLGDRRAVQEVFDQLHVRIMHVPAALTQRTYAAAHDLVLEITDDLVPHVAGTWHLHVDIDGTASCERSTRAPDIRLGVRELGAAYLGGTTWEHLARTGFVEVLHPHEMLTASRAWLHDPAPWSTHVF